MELLGERNLKLLNSSVIAALILALMVSASFNVVLTANLNDHGRGGPDTVTWVLFRYHQVMPEAQLLAGHRWHVTAWDSSGITYTATSHNGMTNCMMNFLQYGLASTEKNSTGLGYIALSTNATAPVTSDQKTNCWMQGEVTTNGLERAAGAVTLNSTALSNLVVVFKLTHTFIATGTVSNVYEAGMTYWGTGACSDTYPNNKCYVAITQLPNAPINFGANDQLAATWTETWTGT